MAKCLEGQEASIDTLLLDMTPLLELVGGIGRESMKCSSIMSVKRNAAARREAKLMYI